MMFFIIILVLFVLLILISISNTFISLSLKLVTRERYKEHCLILPSLLSLALWSAALVVTIKTFTSITKVDFMDLVSAHFLKIADLSKLFPSMIMLTGIIIAMTLILQSIALLTVNINYRLLYNKLRYFIKEKFKLVKQETSPDDGSEIICRQVSTDIEEVKEENKLTFVNSFVCSLFIFSLLFFLGILLFWIGTSVGNTFI